jgi:hypothetical protein
MTDAHQRAARIALKEERAQAAARAMRDYDAQRLSVLAKTARLRALRLAIEKANVIHKPVKKRVENR